MRSKSDQRREQIAAVAAQLFAERGFDDTSIDDIVKRVGGSKTTIYAYFGSKEGLLRGVLDFDLSNWIGNMSDTLLAEEDLKQGLAALGMPISLVCSAPTPSAIFVSAPRNRPARPLAANITDTSSSPDGKRWPTGWSAL